MKNTSKEDMEALATAVETIPETEHVRIASFILGQGLMIAPWWLRSLQWMVRKVRRWQSGLAWFMILRNLSHTDIPADFIKQFADHIRNGKDQYDAASVGGLSQPEVDTTVILLQFVEPLKG